MDGFNWDVFWQVWRTPIEVAAIILGAIVLRWLLWGGARNTMPYEFLFQLPFFFAAAEALESDAARGWIAPDGSALASADPRGDPLASFMNATRWPLGEKASATTALAWPASVRVRVAPLASRL